MRRASIVLSILILGLSSVALAAPDAAAVKEAAARLDAGQKAFTDGDWAQAVVELNASVAAAPTPKALLLLGNAYTKLGNLDDAKGAFERYLQLDPSSKRAQTVKRLIQELGAMGKTRLRIESTPPGATVYLDLRAAGSPGKTPLTVPIAPGRHRVILDLEGHETQTVPAVAVEGQEVVVGAPLRVKGCDVELVVSPSGTEVRVDAEAKVATPPSLRVRTGTHTIEFSGKGLVTRSQTVMCNENRPLRVEEQLPAADGILIVKAPRGSRVTVDGKQYSPEAAARLLLPAGDHEVNVTADGMLPWQKTATLAAGEETRLDAALAPAPVEAPKVVEKPIYKKPWFWAVVGGAVVVAGAGVGIGVAASGPPDFNPNLDPGRFGAALNF